MPPLVRGTVLTWQHYEVSSEGAIIPMTGRTFMVRIDAPNGGTVTLTMGDGIEIIEDGDRLRITAPDDWPSSLQPDGDYQVFLAETTGGKIEVTRFYLVKVWTSTGGRLEMPS